MPTKPPARPSTKAKVAARKKRSSSAKRAAARRTTPGRRGSKPAARSADLPEAGGLVQELELDRAPHSRGETRTVPRAAAAPVTVGASSRGASRSRREVTVFLRQLILLLESGTPILKGLKSLARRGEHKGVRALVGSIAEYVEAGNPLWQAFAREGRDFPAVEVNLIKAAEASGTLPAVLRRIVDFRDQRDRLEKKVQIAMIYPATVVVVAFVAIVILSMFVIPAFKEIFDSMDVELGAYTKFIMWAADTVTSLWLVIVIVIALLWALYKFVWVRNPVRQLQSDRIWLKLPVFGSILRRRTVAGFMRTFAMLLRSGVSMMATLDLCKNSVSNRAYVGVIQDMRDSVERGDGLEGPLREAEKNGYLSGVTCDMLLTGEESGSLERVAEQVAVAYEEEVDLAVSGLTESIIPIFVVVMGFIVGGIVMGLFLPLVSMIETLSSGQL